MRRRRSSRSEVPGNARHRVIASQRTQKPRYPRVVDPKPAVVRLSPDSNLVKRFDMLTRARHVTIHVDSLEEEPVGALRDYLTDDAAQHATTGSRIAVSAMCAVTIPRRTASTPRLYSRDCEGLVGRDFSPTGRRRPRSTRRRVRTSSHTPFNALARCMRRSMASVRGLQNGRFGTRPMSLWPTTS